MSKRISDTYRVAMYLRLSQEDEDHMLSKNKIKISMLKATVFPIKDFKSKITLIKTRRWSLQANM